MKRIAVLAAFVLLPCIPALTLAQGDKPAAAAPAAKAAATTAAKPAEKPAPAAEAKPAAPEAKPVEKPAEKSVAKPAARKVSRARDTRDARECLKLATNTGIIKCAEKYR